MNNKEQNMMQFLIFDSGPEEVGYIYFLEFDNSFNMFQVSI